MHIYFIKRVLRIVQNYADLSTHRNKYAFKHTRVLSSYKERYATKCQKLVHNMASGVNSLTTDQAYITEPIIQTAAVATKAVVQAIFAERDRDELTRHRNEEADVRSKLGRPSETFKFTKEVKSICQIHDIDKVENIQVLKICYADKISYQAEQEECNETVKSL